MKGKQRMCEKNTEVRDEWQRRAECARHIEAAIVDLRMGKRWVSGDLIDEIGENIECFREALELARSRIELAEAAIATPEESQQGGGS